MLMQLRIENCEDQEFIYYVIRFLKKYIKSNTNRHKLVKLDEFLSKQPEYNTRLVKNLKCMSVINKAVNSFTFKYFQDGTYIITIDENKNMIGTRAKLYDTCKLINYGNMSIQGYPIFTEAFKYVEDNLDLLYIKYKRGY